MGLLESELGKLQRRFERLASISKTLVLEGKYLAEAGLRFLDEKRLRNEDILSYLIGNAND